MATKSVFERILDKGMEALRRPFVVNRVNRAFSSANDSIDEQLMDNEASLNGARENLVNSAKNEGNLTSSVQTLINLQVERKGLEEAKKALAAEKKAFLEDKTEVVEE